MSIAQAERRLAPVLNYDPASVDEAAGGEMRPSSSRPCGHGGCGSGVWRVKKAAAKKRLSRRVTRFAGGGCIKMSNNAAERAMRPIALGGKNCFVLIPAPEDGAAIVSTLIETAKRNDVEGVHSSSRSREASESDHGRRLALSFRAPGSTRQRAMRAGAARKQTYAGVA